MLRNLFAVRLYIRSLALFQFNHFVSVIGVLLGIHLHPLLGKLWMFWMMLMTCGTTSRPLYSVYLREVTGMVRLLIPYCARYISRTITLSLKVFAFVMNWECQRPKPDAVPTIFARSINYMSGASSTSTAKPPCQPLSEKREEQWQQKSVTHV